MFQTGDLVENKWGDLGIIIRQIGVIDRWLVQYLTGSIIGIDNMQGEWGDNLYLITKNKKL